MSIIPVLMIGAVLHKFNKIPFSKKEYIGSSNCSHKCPFNIPTFFTFIFSYKLLKVDF